MDLVGTAIAQVPDLPFDLAQFTFDGQHDGDQLGRRAQAVGDVDGDGIVDLIVTARFSDAGGVDSGEVFIFSGSDGHLLYRFAGDNAYDEFGHRLAVVGDVTGDNHADILIGAFDADVGGQVDIGRMYLYDGRNGDLITRWTGEGEGDEYAYALENCGDVDLDGYDDVIVGAPGNDNVGINAGSTYVISLKQQRVLYTYYGQAAGDNFGFYACGVGDVNRDGYADFAVGAPRHNSGNASNAGRLYVYSGKSGNLVFTMDGERSGARLAERIQKYDDVDDDGYDDIIVAANTATGLGEMTGVVYVISGRNGDVIYRHKGEAAGDQFGLRILGDGDLDNDGLNDFIVAAPYNDAGGTDAGRVYVFSGRTGSPLLIKTGENDGDNLGRPLGGLWDVNGDEYDDLVVAAHPNDGNGYNSGRVYAFSGRTRTALFQISGGYVNGNFGFSVASADDINQDGLPDFCVGAPAETPGGRDQAGRAYLYLSHPVYLGTSDFYAGNQATVTVTGADKDEDVSWYASLNGIGQGPTLTKFGGIVADLLPPIYSIGTARTDLNGQAAISVTVPDWLAGRTVYWQAFIRRGWQGNDSVKSNATYVEVQK